MLLFLGNFSQKKIVFTFVSFLHVNFLILQYISDVLSATFFLPNFKPSSLYVLERAQGEHLNYSSYCYVLFSYSFKGNVYLCNQWSWTSTRKPTPPSLGSRLLVSRGKPMPTSLRIEARLLLYCFSKEGILIVFTWFGLIRFLVWFISPRLNLQERWKIWFFFSKKKIKN